MNDRFLKRTLPGLALTAALTLGGVVVGRALHHGSDRSDRSDLSDLTDLTDLTDTAAPTATVQVPLVRPVWFGDDAPPPVDPADESLGLGLVSGAAEFELADVEPAAAEVPGTEPAVETSSPVVASDLGEVAGAVPIPVAESLASLEMYDTGAESGETAGAEQSAGPDGATFGSGVRVLDPCAPADGGSAPAGCPEGARSTVLALASPPPLVVYGRQGRRGESPPGRGIAACGITEWGTDDLMVNVISNAPGTSTVTVTSPTEGAELARVESTIDSAATAEWQARLGALSAADDSLTIGSCALVEGVGTGDFGVHVDFVDIFGRVSSFTIAAVVGPELRRPSSLVVPVSRSQVYVSVPHTADQSVAIFTEPGDDRSRCATDESLALSGSQRVEVDPTRLRAAGYLDQYVRRTYLVIRLPAGSTTLVCMRTFNTVGPSFEQDRPALVESAVLHAPDVVLPVVSVEDIDVDARLDAADVKVSIRLPRSSYDCGVYRWSVVRGTVSEVPPFEAGTTARPCSFRERLVADATPVSVVSTIDTTPLDSGGRVTQTAAIAVRPVPCRGAEPGVCPRPETEWYRLPVGTAAMPVGICSPGIFESSCEPPRREVVVGTVLVRVAWEDHEPTGRSGWAVDPIESVGRTGPAARPLVDVYTQWTFDGDEFAPVATHRFLADRPVSWRVTRSADNCAGSDDAAAEFVDTEPSSTFEVVIDDLCPGSVVPVEVEVTDPTSGAVTRQSRGFQVPAIERNLQIDLQVARPYGVGGPWTPTTVNVVIDSGPRDEAGWAAVRQRIEWPVSTDPAQRCEYDRSSSPDTPYGRNRWVSSGPVFFAPDVRVRVEVVMVRYVSGPPDARGRPTCVPPRSSWYPEEPLTMVATAELTLEQLLGPEGVRVEATDPRYGFGLVLDIGNPTGR